MAVKPEQIKARLRVLFPKANLSTKRLDAIAAKLATKPADDADDAAIDDVLNTANDFMSFEDIAKEDDRIRTLEANQKPKDPATPPVPPTDPPTPPADDPNKALLEAINALKTEMQELKTGEITKTKRQTAAQAIEASEVFKNLKPELKSKWVDRVKLDAETSIEDQVKDFEVEFTDLRQNFADSSEFAGLPPRSSADIKPNEADVKSIVDNII